MTNNGIVTIHGKEYMTVARRVELARQENALEGVETEVLNHDPVVIKATVKIKGNVFTGISSVNLDSLRMIEKQNPYEVAETSAVGRALGFAGYGLLESIASADEMIRTSSSQKEAQDPASVLKCEICGKLAVERRGTTKGGKQYQGIFCSSQDKTHTKWLWN